MPSAVVRARATNAVSPPLAASGRIIVALDLDAIIIGGSVRRSSGDGCI
jgi:hypothetical protein